MGPNYLSTEADLRNEEDDPENDRLMRMVFFNGSMIPTANIVLFLHSVLRVWLHDNVAGGGL
jgi:hypothetical protein